MDLTVSCVCFRKTVIDIGTKSLKRNCAFMIMFRSCDFRTAETAGKSYFDSLCSEAHRSADSLFHGTAECDSLFELRCNAFSYELSVHIGALNLCYVDRNSFAQYQRGDKMPSLFSTAAILP